MRTYHFLLGFCLILLLVLAAGCRDEQAAKVEASTIAQPVLERVVGELQEPVALVFLSSTQWLVAERRTGRIRWIENRTLRAEPFSTVQVPNPPGYHEYGLLGLAVHPDYPNTPYIYAFHTVPDSRGRAAGQRIVRFTAREGRGVEPQTIVDNLPAGTSCCHNGGRIMFGPDGKLYVTVGDTQRSESAQDYAALSGKVLRYNADGSIPADNPFEEPRTGRADDPEPQQPNRHTPVFTIGHRNPFGITFNPDSGEIYITENGPNANDEINHLVAGDNYGWPEALGNTDNPRFRAPVWASGGTVIAPTGAAFYTGDDLPQFRGNLFFAAYNDGRLRRVALDGEDTLGSITVVSEAGSNARLDVAMGPDGYLYFTSTDAIYRLRAK